MSPLEARRIVEALANGTDPETGEILPEQSAFNSPQVIRALFIAVKNLDSAVKRVERAKALPDNAGRSWSEKEDEELLALFDSGVSVKDIAQRHARTLGAITARLGRLGRVKERADAYQGTQPSPQPDPSAASRLRADS
jgi:hypothetical protein